MRHPARQPSPTNVTKLQIPNTQILNLILGIFNYLVTKKSGEMWGIVGGIDYLCTQTYK